MHIFFVIFSGEYGSGSSGGGGVVFSFVKIHTS